MLAEREGEQVALLISLIYSPAKLLQCSAAHLFSLPHCCEVQAGSFMVIHDYNSQLPQAPLPQPDPLVGHENDAGTLDL